VVVVLRGEALTREGGGRFGRVNGAHEATLPKSARDRQRASEETCTTVGPV